MTANIQVEFVRGKRTTGTALCTLEKKDWKDGATGRLVSLTLDEGSISNWLDMRLVGEFVPGLRITVSYDGSKENPFAAAIFMVGQHQPKTLLHSPGIVVRRL